MKLSAFLAVSLPLMAMSQAPAFAQDAMADTGNWLKASIATLKPAPKPVQQKITRQHISLSAAPSAHMRPFVPNRFLPHENDLRRALVAQQARVDNSISMDPASPRALSGEVNTSYAAPRAVSAYDQYAMSSMYQTQAAPRRAARPTQAKAVIARAPRVMPGQAPMLPEQLTPNVPMPTLVPEPPQQKMTSRPQFPVSMPVAGFQQPQMPVMPQMQQQMALQQQMQMQMQPQMQMQQPMQMQMQPQMQMQQNPAFTSQAGAPLLSQPALTPQEQMVLSRLVAQNKPTAFMDFNGDIHGMPQDNPANGTGPAPFPMNLLPGNAMQYLHQSHRHANVPQARFGSWHETSSLPEAGFQSYLGHRQPHLFDYTMAPLPRQKSAQSKRPGTSARASMSAQPGVAKNAQPKQKPVMVATYPSYVSTRGSAY